MKYTFVASALAAVLGFALASVPVTAQAQTATNVTAPAAPSTAPKTETATKKTPYKGQITAIDASSVTVKGASASLTLAITADTQFEFGTAKKHTPATAADFAVGDKITGSYIKNSDGTMTAASVRKKQVAK